MPECLLSSQEVTNINVAAEKSSLSYTYLTTTIIGLLNSINVFSATTNQFWWKCLLHKPMELVIKFNSVVVYILLKTILRIFEDACDYSNGMAFTATIRLYNPTAYSTSSNIYGFELTEEAIESSFTEIFSITDSSNSSDTKISIVYRIPYIVFKKLFDFTEGENTYNLIDALISVLRVSDNAS